MVRKSHALTVLAAAACWAPATSAQDPSGIGGGPPPGAGGMPYGAPTGMPPADLGGAISQHYLNGGGVAPAHGQFPGDMFGPQRMQMPPLTPNHDYAGGTMRNEVVRPDTETIGIRLDSSYTLLREIELGAYLSERQSVGTVGGTILPFQAPGWVFGFRGLATYNGNNSQTANFPGFTMDPFLSTRYKHTYLKIGALADYTSRGQSFGGTFAMLTRLPLIGNVTLDTAISSGSGGNDQRLPVDPLTGRLQRVENAQHCSQVRVGKFLSNWVQVGLSATVTNYAYTRDEAQYGIWGNWKHGGKIFGWDLAGGRGGLRGYATMGLNWGAGRNIDMHPIDTGYDNPLDTVSWATIAPRRDSTIRLRRSNTGDPPPAVVPVIQ